MGVGLGEGLSLGFHERSRFQGWETGMLSLWPGSATDPQCDCPQIPRLFKDDLNILESSHKGDQ
jgi:hypothetical protein